MGRWDRKGVIAIKALIWPLWVLVFGFMVCFLESSCSFSCFLLFLIFLPSASTSFLFFSYLGQLTLWHVKRLHITVHIEEIGSWATALPSGTGGSLYIDTQTWTHSAVWAPRLPLAKCLVLTQALCGTGPYSWAVVCWAWSMPYWLER